MPSDRDQIYSDIVALTSEEGEAVTINAPNPDFNDLPDYGVDVIGAWTDWTPVRFGGDTLLMALDNARYASAKAKGQD